MSQKVQDVGLLLMAEEGIADVRAEANTAKVNCMIDKWHTVLSGAARQDSC